MSEPLAFPADFLWGTATAAYQVEGAARDDGRGPSIWDTFSHEPGRVRDGHTGDVACDHYHRWESDLDLLADLGVNSYRFSVSWPRVQPGGHGPINQRGLDFYCRLAESLARRGIRPSVTLYHWDLPQELQDAGGWQNRDTAERFGEYAAVIGAALGQFDPLWLTLNEPWCSAFLGYGTGEHAPGITGSASALSAAHHLLLAHARATTALRSAAPGSATGLALNLVPPAAASGSLADRLAAARFDDEQNNLWLDPLLHGRYPDGILQWYARATDFSYVRDGDLADIAAAGVDHLGVNYYTYGRLQASRPQDMPPPQQVGIGADDVVDPGEEVSTMGWPTRPDGLTRLLLDVDARRPGLPLYITENGMALPDEVPGERPIADDARRNYLHAHLQACHRAIVGGVNLRGYYVWTLMDNFEWAHGYHQTFGLVSVDRQTLRRTPKRSADFYAEVARTNSLPPRGDH